MQGYTVFTAMNADEAVERYEKFQPSLVIIDDDPAGVSAVSIAAQLKRLAVARHRRPPATIALRGDYVGREEPILVEFGHVLKKPLDFDWLDELVRLYSLRHGVRPVASANHNIH